MKKQHAEATVDMREHERRKMQRKQKETEEKKKVCMSWSLITRKILCPDCIGVRSHSALQPLGAARCRSPKGTIHN